MQVKRNVIRTSSCTALLLMVCLGGCVRHRVSVSPNDSPLEEAESYVDLRPGWKIRVTTPLWRAGGSHDFFSVPELSPRYDRTKSNVITLSSSPDLLGYETAIYAVQSQRRGGVRITFEQATKSIGESQRIVSQPSLKMFSFPKRMNHVRLVFKTRISKADHDMAVVAASDFGLLDDYTKQLVIGSRECFQMPRIYCKWVPTGVAVRPEMGRANRTTTTGRPAK